MPNMDEILKLHLEIVEIRSRIDEIDQILLEKYKKSYIDGGNGCKIPPLQITDKPIKREAPPCCD